MSWADAYGDPPYPQDLRRQTFEAAPVTADKLTQLIEKSLASPSVLAMLLTTMYADGIPLYRFELMLNRHGADRSRQTLVHPMISI